MEPPFRLLMEDTGQPITALFDFPVTPLCLTRVWPFQIQKCYPTHMRLKLSSTTRGISKVEDFFHNGWQSLHGFGSLRGTDKKESTLTDEVEAFIFQPHFSCP